MERVQAIFVVLLISISTCCGQRMSIKDSTTVSMASQFYYGTILAHSKTIVDLTGSYIWGWQADVSRIRYTKAAWSICNCYSENGISLSYFNFNNPQELGKAINLALFAEPRLTLGRLFLSFRAGMGIAYVTRVYHPDLNPRNLFFSTPWSGLLMIQLSTRYRLAPQWSLRFGASYQHISNGGQRQPNKGMNFPLLGLGVEYATEYQKLRPRARYADPDKTIHYYAEVSYNTRSLGHMSISPDERKTVFGLHAGLYKPIANMHAVGVGLEFSHDGLLKELARQTPDPYDHRVLSGLVAHHLLFGRFDFSPAIGFYIYKEYPERNSVFQRYAMYYQMFEKLRLGLSLKAHLEVAEQMDVRIGIVL